MKRIAWVVGAGPVGGMCTAGFAQVPVRQAGRSAPERKPVRDSTPTPNAPPFTGQTGVEETIVAR